MEEEQPGTALLRSPDHEHLYRTVVDRSGYWINQAAWMRARAAREYVGTCRQCGDGHLVPDPTPPAHHSAGDESHLEWLSATCERCGHEVALPAGKVLKSSSSRRRSPAGWWRGRNTALKGRDTS